MTRQPASAPSARGQLAAEFALGVLDGADYRRARRLLATDADFASLVASWAARLGPLLDEVEPIAAPEALWRRIESRLAPPRSEGGNASLRRRLDLWRGMTGGMTAIAAALAMILLLRPAPLAPPAAPIAVQPAAAPMVAVLAGDSSMKLVANWDPNQRRLVLAVAGAMPADDGKSHELWVIPADGKPRSLGTMPNRKMMGMQLEQALGALLRSGATIAISIEPPGGSPTGLPTGPVIASGTLEKV